MVVVKKAVRAGNSSAVILPRAWLNQEIRVELISRTPEIILKDVIDITKKYINLKDVVGIYLTGSYARGEEDKMSDIDVLILSSNIDKEMINEGIYNILIVSTELLQQKLEKDILPVGPMLKEAVSLLNSQYLQNIDIKITKKNIKWYLDTTKDKLILIKKVINRIGNKEYVSNLVAYTIILRIRTLHIIKRLMRDEDYSKKDFLRILRKVSGGESAYQGYLDIKNNQGEKDNVDVKEVRRLYEYLGKELVEVNGLVKG